MATDDVLDLEAEFPGRWVRVMCDYSAEGLWNQRGEACDPKDLPIPAELVNRFEAWQNWYEDRDPDESQTWGDVGAFSEEGLDLAKAVKRALPDWTVIYFDEAKAPRGANWEKEPRRNYEYEIG